jgi:hypothetical protein
VQLADDDYQASVLVVVLTVAAASMLLLTVIIQLCIFVRQDGSSSEQTVFVSGHHFDIKSREKCHEILLGFYIYGIRDNPVFTGVISTVVYITE